MNKLLASFGWILLLLPFISVAGTKTILHSIHTAASSENRQVSNFNSISSSGSFDVYIKMGISESLKITGDEDVFENIETKVENGILKIRAKKSINNWGWSSGEKVKIYITAKSLTDLTLSGSGAVRVEGTIKSSQLNAVVSGSGSMDLNANSLTLNATISGSGSLTASGFAEKTRIVISGSGQFKGQNLKSNIADIKVSGSGGAWIHADEVLNASVSGSGNISYSGNPQVSQSTSGSGRVRKI